MVVLVRAKKKGGFMGEIAIFISFLACLSEIWDFGVSDYV